MPGMSPAQARGESEARTTEGSGHLDQGRRSFAAWTWLEAYEALARADEAAPLAAEDLELLATSAYMLGRDDEWMRNLERAHQLYVDAEETQRAARCAIWVGINLAAPRRGGRRERLARPCSAAARARRSRVRGARLSVATRHVPARGGR